jgi:glycosyltransferase involved in cell wall biosynthesis
LESGVNVSFASAAPYLPQLVGGVNANTHELVCELSDRGISASVLARLSYGNVYGARAALSMQMTGKKLRRDETLGYPVFRARKPWRHVKDLPRPDVIVLQDGQFLRMAAAIGALDIPIVGYFHGLEFEDWDQADQPFMPDQLPVATYVVNSQFTARRFRERHGVAPFIVNPVFRPERYQADWSPSNVTFINPVPEKGLDLALAIARLCPEIPFAFVKGWPLGLRQAIALRGELRSLSNIKLIERTSDMRSIYSKCRVLLVPSVWPRETWGRVASEAQIMGIPVLGSDIGGLPESIGDGGLVLPSTAAPQVWAEALKKLWCDQEWFQEKSRLARLHSLRPAVAIDRQMDSFIEILKRAASRKPSSVNAVAAAGRERSGARSDA